MRHLASLAAAAVLMLGFAGEVLAGGGTCTGDFVILECQLDSEGDFSVFALGDDGDEAPPGIDVGDECTEALDRLYNSSGPIFSLMEASTGSTDRTVYTWFSCL